ncbi:MAG: DUF4360 domain-containing protein [Longispora sp.]|nr:DUF4360 domain-containing protein [Longispora sp. (in: high G+C Gram-positive bacteria)]
MAVAAATVSALALAGPAHAALNSTNSADSVPPGKITINVATVNGSGCPAGTTAIAVSPDNTAFTVTYSNYLAQVGAGAKPTDFRKNCQLNLRVNVPQGFTYAIANADYRGFASLARGATGFQQASYYFQGMSGTASASRSFTGPFTDNWQTTHRVPISALVYAPCGERRNFNINTELRVNRGSSSPSLNSMMAMDSTDGSINTIFQLAWKRC